MTLKDSKPKIGDTNGHGHTWLACKDCSKERWVYTNVTKRPHFTGLCSLCWGKERNRLNPQPRGAASPVYKGGRVVGGKGYIQKLVLPDDLCYPMTGFSNYIPEHRYIMAHYLGRCLETWEIVHHLNGIVNDNRIENLELLPRVVDHLPSMFLQKEVSRLKERVAKLEKENRLLKWLFKEQISKVNDPRW